MAEGVDIVLERVSVQLGGRVVLQDLNFRASRSEVTAVLGPSGCGKTTLLRLIAGLVPPVGGSVFLEGLDAVRVAPWQRGIGMVFQGLALYPHMTVRANLEFSLRGRGISSSTRAAKIQWASELFEFESWLDRYPDELSGGEQQRVALGRAIVSEPKVLLLDEPFSHLDAPLRLRLRESLLSWQSTHGSTCIVVTHDAADAMAMADRMVVMSEGCVLQEGVPEEVYRNPVNRLVAQFTGSTPMNWLHGTLGEAGVELDDLGIVWKLEFERDALPGTRVEVAIRSVDWVWRTIETAELCARSASDGTSSGVHAMLSGFRGVVRRCHRWEDRWLIAAEIYVAGQATDRRLYGIYQGPRPEVGSWVEGATRECGDDGGAALIPSPSPGDGVRVYWMIFELNSGRRLWPN